MIEIQENPYFAVINSCQIRLSGTTHNPYFRLGDIEKFIPVIPKNLINKDDILYLHEIRDINIFNNIDNVIYIGVEITDTNQHDIYINRFGFYHIILSTNMPNYSHMILLLVKSILPGLKLYGATILYSNSISTPCDIKYPEQLNDSDKHILEVNYMYKLVPFFLFKKLFPTFTQNPIIDNFLYCINCILLYEL